MIPAYSLSEIKKRKPCADRWKNVTALKLGKGKLTAKDAVAAGVSFDDLVWTASAIAKGKDEASLDVKFRLTGWMADVAAHVLHVFENMFPDDTRPREAIEATHKFIRGQIDEKEWAAEAAGAAGAAWAAEAAEAAGAAGAAWAAWAAWAAEAAWAAWAAEAAEQQWQLDRLVYWLSEERPKFYPLPEKQNAKAA